MVDAIRGSTEIIKEKKMNNTGIKMVCSLCGSDDVTRQAHAKWSRVNQRWETESLEDVTSCYSCGDGVMLEEKEVNEKMIKVYPRDLFNDANLLKCVGQLALLYHERENDFKGFTLTIPEPYEIVMDEADGATFVYQMSLINRDRMIVFKRPLNSREAWPLIFEEIDKPECCFDVFTDTGALSQEFIKTLGQEYD